MKYMKKVIKYSNILLNNNIKKGDRVLIILDNSIEYVISIFSILNIGSIFVPLNIKIVQNKLNYIISNVNPKAIITNEIIKIKINNIIKNKIIKYILINDIKLCRSKEKIIYNLILNKKQSIIDKDIAAIIFTSGSMGTQKGVTLTHLNIITSLKSINNYLNKNNNKDIILNLLPFSFDYGLYQIFLSFFCGGTLVIYNEIVYISNVIDYIEKYQITAFPILPAIIELILKIKNLKCSQFQSLRYITNTGQKLSESTINNILMLMPRAKIYSMYGLTECKRISYQSWKKLNINQTQLENQCQILKYLLLMKKEL